MTAEFTKDWSHTREHWPDLFDRLALPGRDGLSILEVGCFEGQSTLWLAEQVAYRDGAGIVVVDPFDIYEEQEARFRANLAGHMHKIEVIAEASATGLVYLLAQGYRFDFIYIDGSHRTPDVLTDAVLAWQLLRKGSAMLFDDYYWPDHPPGEDVGQAVRAFMDCFDLNASAELVGADQMLVWKLR